MYIQRSLSWKEGSQQFSPSQTCSASSPLLCERKANTFSQIHFRAMTCFDIKELSFPRPPIFPRERFSKTVFLLHLQYLCWKKYISYWDSYAYLLLMTFSMTVMKLNIKLIGAGKKYELNWNMNLLIIHWKSSSNETATQYFFLQNRVRNQWALEKLWKTCVF